MEREKEGRGGEEFPQDEKIPFMLRVLNHSKLFLLGPLRGVWPMESVSLHYIALHRCLELELHEWR